MRLLLKIHNVEAFPVRSYLFLYLTREILDLKF
jgi:hypothetical protein